MSWYVVFYSKKHLELMNINYFQFFLTCLILSCNCLDLNFLMSFCIEFLSYEI